MASGQALTVTLGLQNAPGTWHIALFVENPKGKVEQLLPNRRSGGNLSLTNGQSIQFPSVSSNLEIIAVGEDVGVNTLLMYASKQPLNLESISSYDNADSSFATMLESRQGVGSLEGAIHTALAALNPGIFTTAKVTVTK